MRLNIWQSAIAASEKNFIWGSGHEKTDMLLLKEYEYRDLKIPLKYKYHAHNQFLQTLIQYGVVGTIILIVFLVLAIWRTWEHRNYMGLTILMLFIFTMFTEAIFTRQWGVLSFTFIISIVLISYENQDKKIIN